MIYQLSYQDSLEREGYICGYGLLLLIEKKRRFAISQIESVDPMSKLNVEGMVRFSKPPETITGDDVLEMGFPNLVLNFQNFDHLP